MRSKLIKFMDIHQINDDLLREFIWKGKLDAAMEQIGHTYTKYENKLLKVEALQEGIERENANNK
jgi:hypothetical protein